MSEQGIVYGLVDGDTLELRYVGQTIKSPEERFAQHQKRTPNLHLRQWLDKRPVNIIVLERVPASELDDAEIRWVAGMRSQGARLINQTNGGEGTRGHTLSDEHRVKISVALMGHKLSDETKVRISAAKMGNQGALGHTHSDETRAKLSAAAMGNHNTLGHKLTPEHRAKISVALRSRKKQRSEA